jgi:hypothetical protein
MTGTKIAIAAVLFFTLSPVLAAARVWTDATGQYTIEADLIAFNDNTVVLQRKGDQELGAISMDKLSEADREFPEAYKPGLFVKVSRSMAEW